MEGTGAVGPCRAPGSVPRQGDNRGAWDGARQTLLTDTFDGTYRCGQNNAGDNTGMPRGRTSRTGASAQPQGRGQQGHEESLHFTHQYVSNQGGG